MPEEPSSRGNDTDRSLTPEVVESLRGDVQPTGYLDISVKKQNALKVVGGIGTLTFAGWWLQNFLQLRGVVDLLASRITLVGFSACLFCAAWIVTSSMPWKLFLRILAIVFSIAIWFGLDAWAPKPAARVAVARIEAPAASANTKESDEKKTLRQKPSVPRTRSPAPHRQESPPIIFQQLPSLGNLSERADTLANEIAMDLVRHGDSVPGYHLPNGMLPMQQMPKAGDEFWQWTKLRSVYFRFRFLPKVIKLRDEFAELHFHDESLDNILAGESANASQPDSSASFPIFAQTIAEVSERIKVLAAKVK